MCHANAVVVLAIVLWAGTSAFAGDRISSAPDASRSEVFARNGMAATSQPLATQVAIEILRRGGSAVDAAIAANATLGLMEPTGSGIGGDLFAIVWDAKTQKLYGLNASGRSPLGLSLDELRNHCDGSIPAAGPWAVTIPGCVDGWFELHRRFGRLPMDVVLAPAISYARDGFPVSELIAFYWAKGVEKLGEQPNFRSTYTRNGAPPAKGDVFRNPDLARTYEVLTTQGRDAFYRGPLADTISAFCERVGCRLRRADLERHESTWVDPVSTNYRGVDVWALPPNTQGIAVLQMLNILQGFDLKSMGHNSGDYLHHLIETKKIVFEDRALHYADPAFGQRPVAELISPEYAAIRRALVNPLHASSRIPAGDPRTMRSDTVYLTVADKDRNFVSLIQSNYRGFGSGLVPDGLGFVLQNRGQLFALDAGHPNVYAPGKRPFHTIIPGFVTKNGRPWLSFGVMGGDMQPQGQVQVLCNIIDFQMNLQEAGDAPRFHHLGSSEPTGEVMTDGGWVSLESGVPAESVRILRDRGHTLKPEAGGYGGYQAIMYDSARDVLIGASESRSDGQAAGY